MLRAESDAGIAVTDGVITDRGPFARVRAAHPDAEVVDLTGGVVLPGLVDTHVHFPQVRVIGALGMPLLDWLDRCALPEEARMADVDYARAVAAEFVDGLIWAGTTTALVFGAHFASAVDCLFERAAASGMRVSAGLVVSDRLLRPELLTTPGAGVRRTGWRWPSRWHRKDRLRYAVTPVLALGQRPDAESVRSAAAGRRRRAVHLATSTRTPRRSTPCADLFPECDSYVDTYGRYRLLGRRSVLAHNVHPADAELDQLAAAGASVRALPVPQQRAGQRAVPVAPARRARRAGGAGHRRGRRHRLLASQRGPPVLLHAGPARRGRAAADRGAHAVPGHRGRAPPRWRWTARSVTCRWANSSTRSGSARNPAAPWT